mmetsp:Transcript_73836/g.209127  ORF Transcript_73836/g.209127 Transcript_73836/m.209127 type:complete len:294 (-) Transcript_73836:162-1043(-)
MPSLTLGTMQPPSRWAPGALPPPSLACTWTCRNALTASRRRWPCTAPRALGSRPRSVVSCAAFTLGALLGSRGSVLSATLGPSLAVSCRAAPSPCCSRPASCCTGTAGCSPWASALMLAATATIARFGCWVRGPWRVSAWPIASRQASTLLAGSSAMPTRAWPSARCPAPGQSCAARPPGPPRRVWPSAPPTPSSCSATPLSSPRPVRRAALCGPVPTRAFWRACSAWRAWRRTTCSCGVASSLACWRPLWPSLASGSARRVGFCTAGPARLSGLSWAACALAAAPGSRASAA